MYARECPLREWKDVREDMGQDLKTLVGQVVRNVAISASKLLASTASVSLPSYSRCTPSAELGNATPLASDDERR